MNRFDRQTRIVGWDQSRIGNARVTVCGRNWSGAFTVWALASLGVGEISWMGAPEPQAGSLANFLLAEPSPFPGCRIVDYPFAVEWGAEADWATGEERPDAMLCCEVDALSRKVWRELAGRHGIRFFPASEAGGGWFGEAPAGTGASGQGPVVAMALAALLADSVREAVNPLWNGAFPGEGPLNFHLPPRVPRETWVIVGVGGIGVYAATLAAALGCRVCLVDFDRVEETNLNRQGLFTAEDAARGEFKSVAAARALRRLFPGSLIKAEVRRVDASFREDLGRMSPGVLVSAVDNAAARLALQALGKDLDVPVVQGGTDVFFADCFTQERGGTPLDEQMRGALSEAAQREVERSRRGGCAVDPSYVVPGMMAGALAVLRSLQACELYRGLAAIRWRPGHLPVEERRTADGFDFNELVA